MRADCRRLAAWLGFTLPSALVLIGFAYRRRWRAPLARDWLHGLKIVAVAVVAQAVLAVWRNSLCPDRERASRDCAAAFARFPGRPRSARPDRRHRWAGGVIGLCVSSPRRQQRGKQLLLLDSVSGRYGGRSLISLTLFAALAVRPAGAGGGRMSDHAIELISSFYRSGSLVFGGGHVVLPFAATEAVVPGAAGCGQQRLSRRLWRGASGSRPAVYFRRLSRRGGDHPARRRSGAAIALIAIFLPGVLILMGALPFWEVLRTRPRMQAAVQGINAAVVGLLGVALYNPVWTSAVAAPVDFVIATAAFVLLAAWRTPPLAVVLLCAVAGMAI